MPQKAFQLLLFLLENPGRVLTKREIMDALWPQAFVEGANLTQSIFLLRKALGGRPGHDRYIVTVPGEGYQFTVLPVTVEQTAPSGTALETEVRLDGTNEITDKQVPTAELDALQPAIPIRLEASPVASRSFTGAKHWPMRRWASLVALLLLAVSVVSIRRLQSTPRFKVAGNVVLAEFTNTTGDPAFDTTLRQGLAAHLDQSPEIGLLSDSRIAQTMKLMAQPAEARLTPELGRQVCQRTASGALIDGEPVCPRGHGARVQDR